MNKTVKIIGISIAAGILAFAIFQMALYVWADNIFNKMFGGHIYSDLDDRIEQNKQSQQKMKELQAEFDNINN
jgi:hypothetical protein